MRVAVTGAAGVLGRHLVERLAARDDRVTALDLAFEPPVAAADCVVAACRRPASVHPGLSSAPSPSPARDWSGRPVGRRGRA